MTSIFKPPGRVGNRVRLGVASLGRTSPVVAGRANLTQGNATRAFTEELLTALTDAYRQAHANPETQEI